MQPVNRHPHPADVAFDGGDLDCGNGLLLLIRQHIDPMRPGQLLEIRSTEISVDEDLPSWCRMTGNELISFTKVGKQRSFLVAKGSFIPRARVEAAAALSSTRQAPKPVVIPATLPPPAPAPKIAPLSVMGIGSWPRPRWMVQAIHDHLEGRLSDTDFEATADDAVRLAVESQKRAGAHVLTDGEQRRDSYANFIGSRLDNCQLIPLVDLLPIVDDPEKLKKDFDELDVDASEIRHPAVWGAIGRSRPIAGHELAFLQTLTTGPTKIALPGPYLLSRIMWLECISDRAYKTREDLAKDIVRVLREELHFLLAAGASLVQFDEPVLSEVVFSGPKNTRSFMCGALSAKGDADHELCFARDLINAVIDGAPTDRTAVHVCRGNWTPDEGAALTGDYRPLLNLLRQLKVGTYFLELCTPRAGEIEVLRTLPADRRVGVGVVNQKHERVETVDEIVAKGRKAIEVFGRDRVLLNTDCGFATFADNPVSSAATAEAKLRAMVAASDRLRAS